MGRKESKDCRVELEVKLRRRLVSLWAMWHPHAPPLANDAASGSLSRKNVLIAGDGDSDGGIVGDPALANP